MIALIKKTTFTFFAALLVFGCGSPKIISTPIENIDNIPLKTTATTDKQLKVWGAADIIADTIPGMSIDKAYAELIKNKKGQTVIVCVIDSGVDIEHEDLKSVIWTNTKEIKGNGKDDDQNGYIDDINGWNFLGDAEDENLEFVRIVKKLKPKYTGKNLASVSEADKAEYQLYIQAKVKFEQEYQEALGNKNQYEQILQQTKISHAAISKLAGKENYSQKELLGLPAKTAENQQYVAFLSQMFGFMDEGEKIPSTRILMAEQKLVTMLMI